MQISTHFTLNEATFSSTATSLGYENKPDPKQLEQIMHTALKMEEVRSLLGNRPIQVSSWFRNVEVNKAVGGSPTSDHMTGASVDFKCPRFGTPREIARFLSQHKETLGYDQLILEPTWVHISFPIGRMRKQDLTYRKGKPFAQGIV